MLPLIESFWDTTDKDPERTAVIDFDRRITYYRLVSLVKITALWLNSNGLLRGDRVGIHLPNSIEYIVVYYACWRAGLVPVALNTFATLREIEFWTKDSGCKLIFSNKLKNVSTLVPIYEISMDQYHVTINGQDIHEPLDELELPRVSLDDIATIIYTSGTTGNPKGVALSHRNLVANIQAIIASLEISQDDIFLCVLPFFYSYGNSVLHSHLVAGATLVLQNQVTYPAEILKTIEREQCNGFAAVPSLYIMLLSKTGFCGYDLSSLRYMTQAGGPLAVAYVEQIHSLLPDVDFVIMYGQTEATSRISYLPARYLEKKRGSVGIGINGVTISIVDSDGKECRPSDSGEICVQGENIMVGYWGNPEATSEVL
ncbi:MAG: acyl--CoA ligase, partial [Gammaproteobacteria bacterium]|nr:acyl--CoA ligase [Gammaproteobacteria bacterium]